MEDKEYNVATLENGIEYTELYRIKYNENTYVYLFNLDSDDDFCIRKLVNKDGKECIIGLDSKEEFDMALKLFAKENLN